MTESRLRTPQTKDLKSRSPEEFDLGLALTFGGPVNGFNFDRFDLGKVILKL